MQAALAAGYYIPHLCYHPEFKPHGSCKVCTVRVNGHTAASCTMPAQGGMSVQSKADDLEENRRTLVQMLFVEGNHFCPSCEKSGNCLLQAVAYDMGIMSADLDYFYPSRPLDASHPDILLDFNRCILCELCVRASAEVDHKNVFALSGRGMGKHLIVNAESGRLAETDIAVTDKAVEVCPVGVIIRKRVGFAIPIGKRRYDARPVSAQALEDAPRPSPVPAVASKTP
jgi:[NiFe] hydrogenase diaphorase moiety small subunit